MEPVTIVFEGLVLWWLLGSTPMALIPNGDSLPEPHQASISVLAADTVGEECPYGFSVDGSSCTLNFPHHAGPGGIQITTPLNRSKGGGSLSGVPELQSLAMPFALNANYQPPNGPGNVAWMYLGNGTLSACSNPFDAISTNWTLDADAGVVMLQLSNVIRAPGDRPGSITIPLKPGAQVSIVNGQIREISNAHVHHAKIDGEPKPDEGWCLYYRMVNSLPQIGGVPKGMASGDAPYCLPPLPPNVRLPSCPQSPELITTVYCSNSQYP